MTRGLVKHNSNGSSFGAKALKTVQTVAGAAGTAKTLFDVGKGLYTAGRFIAPLII